MIDRGVVHHWTILPDSLPPIKRSISMLLAHLFLLFLPFILQHQCTLQVIVLS
jgi:hypothetical protein